MKHILLGVLLLSIVGCASGPRVAMDPFTPEEIGILAHAAAATYVMEKNVSPETAASVVAYLEVVRSSVSTGTLDLVNIRTELINQVPKDYQPLAMATWVILLKRIHIDQLIANGEYVEARAYIDATLDGVITAFQR